MRAQRRTGAWLSAAMVVGIGLVAARPASAQNPPPLQATPYEYDLNKAVTPPKLSGAELGGKKLFVQRCALCHDTLGQPAATTPGPWVDVETIKRTGEQATRDKIMNGSRRMPGWKYTFELEQVDQIIAYIKTATPDQREKRATSGPVPID